MQEQQKYHVNSFRAQDWLVTWTEDAGWRAVNERMRIVRGADNILAEMLRSAQERRGTNGC